MKRSLDRESNRLQWVARGIGLLLAAYWLFMGVGEALAERGPLTWESAGVGLMIGLAVLVAAASWSLPRATAGRCNARAPG